MDTLNFPLTIKIFRDGSSKEAPFVAHNPEFDISSCGQTEEEAQKMLREAIAITLKGAREDDTLEQLLEETGFSKKTINDRDFPKIYFSVFSFPLITDSGREVQYA